MKTSTIPASFLCLFWTLSFLFCLTGSLGQAVEVQLLLIQVDALAFFCFSLLSLSLRCFLCAIVRSFGFALLSLLSCRLSFSLFPSPLCIPQDSTAYVALYILKNVHGKDVGGGHLLYLSGPHGGANEYRMWP